MRETLNYQTSSVRGACRRLRTIRRTLGTVVFVSMIACVWLWHEPCWKRLRLLKAQRACASYVVPAEQVVYESVPKGAHAALSGEPRSLHTMEANGDAYTLAAPRAWETLLSMLGRSHARSDALLFLGERQTPSGKTRIVGVVRPELDRSHECFVSTIKGFAIAPVGIFGSAELRVTARTPENAEPMFLGQKDTMRFFAGQLDSWDKSHWIMQYELNGKRGSIDGWLQDDERVIIKLKDGPASRRPAAR